MSESRFDIILDLVRANQEAGQTPESTFENLHRIAGDEEAHVLIDQAVGIVFDGRCSACIAHPGWATDNPTQRRDPQDTCRDCFGSGVQHPEPAPLPDINPVETLAEVIAIATSGLLALADEHEGNLRDAVTRLHEKTTALLDLVTLW